MSIPDMPTQSPTECVPTGDAEVRGTVYAPNGELPIGGAVVYTATSAPPPIPDGVYCSECVVPPCDPDWTITQPDGTFSVNAVAGDDRYLVVRKGDFMRVSPIHLEAGVTELSPELTTLPADRDPLAGQYVPKIAVLIEVSWDDVAETLAELGLGDVDAQGSLVSGTERFDVWADANIPGLQPVGAPADLLQDAEALAAYHVVLMPCVLDLSFNPADFDVLKEWVAKGGKLYATDLNAGSFGAAFPQYQTFGSPAVVQPSATVVDDGLLAWLEALPESLQDINPINPEWGPGHFATLAELPEIRLDGISAVTIAEVHEVLLDDGVTDVGHDKFLVAEQGTANEFIATVRGEYGCGRLIFSTHHTTEDVHRGLEALELVLAYLLLEVTTCLEDPQPPPAG